MNIKAYTLGAVMAVTSATAFADKHIDQSTRLLNSIQTGDQAAASVINPNKYIQHNLMVADGIAGFGALLKTLPKDSARVHVVRAFRDGNYVFTHTEYNFFGPKIGFDIFRFENGKIVEHWDNLQETAVKPSPGGHSMIDGPTKAVDLEKTEANKKLVHDFLQKVWVEGDSKALSKYIDGERYVQHNPMIGDGVSGLNKAMKNMAEQGMTVKFDKVHQVLGQGNFVLAVTEGKFGDKPASYYDLFRVQSGKIVEHWDTIETIPPQSEWKNANGKF